MDKNCCGTCKYHKFIDWEWYCINDRSDYYGLETDYHYKCDKQEDRN